MHCEFPTIDASKVIGFLGNLNKIFSSVHNDNRDQINESIVILEGAYMEGYDAKTIISKMNDMLKITTDARFKSKLSTAILNRFWERNYEQPVDLFRPRKNDE